MIYYATIFTHNQQPHLKPKLEPALPAPEQDSKTTKLLLELELELDPDPDPDPEAGLEEEADDIADSYSVPRGLAAVSVIVASESIAAARLPVWARFQGLGGRGRFLIV